MFRKSSEKLLERKNKWLSSEKKQVQTAIICSLIGTYFLASKDGAFNFGYWNAHEYQQFLLALFLTGIALIWLLIYHGTHPGLD
jgi:exoribonuclease R